MGKIVTCQWPERRFAVKRAVWSRNLERQWCWSAQLCQGMLAEADWAVSGHVYTVTLFILHSRFATSGIPTGNGCWPGLPPGLWVAQFRRQVVVCWGSTRDCPNSWIIGLSSCAQAQGVKELKKNIVCSWALLPTGISFLLAAVFALSLPRGFPRVLLSVGNSGNWVWIFLPDPSRLKFRHF